MNIIWSPAGRYVFDLERRTACGALLKRRRRTWWNFLRHCASYI